MIKSALDREDLFEDDKPVINSSHGPLTFYHWHSLVPASIVKSFGVKEPLRCMSYFPVIIKRSHLKKLREYLMNLHNLTNFDEVYKTKILGNTDNAYEQFTVMCTYIWLFHRDEYKWYIHSNV
jgi:hypothetical protein